MVADSAHFEASRLASIPAITQMAEHGARFVCWRYESRNGQETKVPLRTNGQHADTTKAVTWNTLDECLKAVPRLKAVGAGFVLDADCDGICGMDLDGCRDPETGTLEVWARKLIDELNSYTEVSPSGTGVKVYAFVDPVPQLTANKLVIKPANGSGKAQQIEVFTTKRYFALTGQHLDGTPDEICDATEAFERLVAKIAKGAGRRADPSAGIDQSEPSADTMQLIEQNPRLAKLWRGEKDEGDTTASGLDYSLAIALGIAGVTTREVERVLSHYPHGQIGGGKLKARRAARRMAGLLEVAEEARRDPARGDEEAIRLQGGQLHTITAQAAAVLGKATHADPFNGFYRMGGLLVRVARLADAAELNRGGIKRARGALVITSAEADGLQLTLTAAAKWEKYDARRGRWVPADAPSAVANALLATAQDWSEVPILTGIVEAPTLRPDGSVLDQPGYDPATGLLFDPGGTEFPRVPDRPSQDQALQALTKITDLLSGFPFADEASRSVAASGIITPLVRKACRAVPLHCYSAPKMASGKTLLATLAGYVASGRSPVLMSQADDPAEEQKRLLAVLIEGQNVVVIDNIERPLKSDSLCTILTEPVFSGRLLGANRTVRASCAATFFATGNNLAVASDLTARAVSCALDPACERPEEREFQVDLHKVVPERRAEIAVATLTIVRAYLAAGEPKQPIPNFARFEDWSRFVRQPLVWLGMEDPIKGRERIEGRDPIRAQLGMLLEAWSVNYPGESATVAQAIKLASREPAPKERPADTAIRGQLLDAMHEIAGRGSSVDSRTLGNFIAKYDLRVEGGRRFERYKVSHGAVRWKVVGRGELGELGELVSRPSRGMSVDENDESKSDSYVRERGTNSPNSPNYPPSPPPTEPEEFEL